LIKTLLQQKQVRIKQGFPVEKKALLTIAFISVLLMSAVAGVKGWSTPYELDGFFPPTISIESPRNQSCINTVPLSFISRGGDFEPVSIYRLYQLWGGGYSYSLDGQVNVSIAGNTTLTGLPTGTHWIVVFSYYYINTGQLVGPWSVSSEPVYFTLISDAPFISVTTPENKTYNTDDVALNFTIDKPTSWIAYNLDNRENVTISENTTLSELSNGSHHITVYANDTSNNMAASKIIYFNVESSEPSPTTLVIASVITVSVIDIVLLVHFKKRKHFSAVP
jgi:hypothetical protein